MSDPFKKCEQAYMNSAHASHRNAAEELDQLRAELEAERARVIDLVIAGSNLSVAVEKIEGDLEGVDLRVVHDMADQMDEAIARTVYMTPAQFYAAGERIRAAMKAIKNKAIDNAK